MDETMGCFKISAAGMTFDLTDFPDMPEEVRAYLTERHRQIAEDGEKGVTAIGEDHVPEFVNEWLHKAIREKIGRFMVDADQLKVREYPVWKAGVLMDQVIKRRRGDYEKQAAQTPEILTELNRIEMYLRTTFRQLYNMDSDWRELGLRQADRLFQGVMLGMLQLAAQGTILPMVSLDEQMRDMVFASINREMMKEDGGDEA